MNDTASQGKGKKRKLSLNTNDLNAEVKRKKDKSTTEKIQLNSKQSKIQNITKIYNKKGKQFNVTKDKTIAKQKKLLKQHLLTNKTTNIKSSNGAAVGSDRLLSYGINPKKFYKKLKYGAASKITQSSNTNTNKKSIGSGPNKLRANKTHMKWTITEN